MLNRSYGLKSEEMSRFSVIPLSANRRSTRGSGDSEARELISDASMSGSSAVESETISAQTHRYGSVETRAQSSERSSGEV